MMEGNESNKLNNQRRRDEVYSRSVRAGRRTYFFDVKPTRRNDYYLTITESKKKFRPDGTFYYEKYKLFLYKDDFEKFTEGLNDVVEFIRTNKINLSSNEDTSIDENT